MIQDFKSGRIAPGSAMTPRQQKLLGVLADDLGVAGNRDDPGALASLVAQVDTSWNMQTTSAIIDFHDLLAAGSKEDASALRSAFLARCPSAWYREHLGNAC